MLDTLLNHLATTAIGLLIIGGAYLVDLLIGSVKVIFTKNKKWSFKKAMEDFIKALILAVGIEAWVAVWDALGWYAGQLGADIAPITDGVSTGGMFAAIIGGSIYYLKNAFENASEFINVKHIETSVTNPDTDASKKLIEDITDFIVSLTPKEAVEAQLELEKEEGGKGKAYAVRHDNYDNFRADVIGKGFDIDDAYGFQCWDGAALLWQQVGQWLQTGNGCAAGCWNLKRDVNANPNFDLIFNKADVKRGDVVVFGCGQYGHIGFADENYNGSAYIKLLGQNQSSDMKFCVINMNMASFLGAFRFKPWKAAPAPVPAPTPAPKKSNEQIADEVIAGKWGNNPKRKKDLEAAGYDYNAIQAIVDQKMKKPSNKPSTSKTYTVQPGDSLWLIAQKQYGHGSRWNDIYNANKATIGSNPSLIRPGQVLVIP